MQSETRKSTCRLNMLLLLAILIIVLFSMPLIALAGQTSSRSFIPFNTPQYHYAASVEEAAWIPMDGSDGTVSWSNTANIIGPQDGIDTQLVNSSDNDRGCIIVSFGGTITLNNGVLQAYVHQPQSATQDMGMSISVADDIYGCNDTGWTAVFGYQEVGGPNSGGPNWYGGSYTGDVRAVRIEVWSGGGNILHLSRYFYIDAVRVWGETPLTLEVVNSQNNLVSTLNLNADGWPTPNPLTATVTLSCPAGGPTCIGPLNLSINSVTTPRFYVYGWAEVDQDPNSPDLICNETTSGTEFSYQGYTASCPTRGSGGVTVPFAVFAGESVIVQWHVWVQPSTVVDLDFSATWSTNTVTRTVQVPQANIHPIALFQGFFGNSESFVALLFEPLITTLEKMGYQRGHTLFVGKYDYIGDIADAAVELTDQLVNWQVVAQQVDWVNKFPDEQEGFFDLMALSQGALMARTYAQTGTYPVDLHRLLLIGGPNKGAPYVYRSREGLEADAGLWQLGLDFILPLKALTCGHFSVAGTPSNPIIYSSTLDRYETLHDPNCGMFFLPQILPVPGPSDPAYLFDDTGSYPFGRQANPLLEPPPANPVDDPWWSPTNPTPSTTYLNLNSPASLAILSDRIGGFGKLYLLYNDAINEAQGYRVHPNTEVAPLWRNGQVLDPLSFTGPSDGSVPSYSAQAADLWTGSNLVNLNVAGNNREERHANLPIYPESQQKIAQILTGITPPFTTTLNEMNNYVQGDVAAALKGLFITGMSPIELSITDPSGRRLGYDVTTGQIVDEIPTGIYEHLPDDTANLWIFDPLPGDYEFTVVGTDAGSYTILAQFVDATASVPILYKQDNILPAEVLTMTLAMPAKSEDVPYPPDVFAGPDKDALAGMPVTFMGTVSDINPGDTFTSLWDFGDSGSATNTLTPIHTFTDDGAYLVTLTVTDSTGFVVSDTLQVIVTQSPIYLPIILKQASGAATLTAPATDDNLPFISPIPTPTPIPPSSIINNLIANLDVACQQRQVDNQGVCHSLRGKLVKAQQYFNEGATDKAANELRAFINEVTAQQGKHIIVEIANRWITTVQQLLRQLQEQG